MGILVKGVWKNEWYDTKTSGGRFIRWESRYRNWITPDGAPGPTGEGGFAAEPADIIFTYPLLVHGRTAP